MHLHTPRLLQDSTILRIEDLLQMYDADGWLVGAFVRNKLLGRPASHLTVVTTADVVRAGTALARRLGRTATVDTSDSGSTCVTLPDAVATGLRRIRLVSLKHESFQEHLKLTDFTINALAVDVRNHQFIDPFSGYSDLNRGYVRAVDAASFREKPIRMLRAIRLAATLQYSIHLETLSAIQQDAARIKEAPPSAVFGEFMRLLDAPSAAAHLTCMDSVNLLEYIFPELVECQDVAQPVQHTLDVYGHTLTVLSALEELMASGNSSDSSASTVWTPPLDRHFDALQSYLNVDAVPGYTRRLALKLAAVLHDIGKPPTYSVDADGDIHFYGHDEAGAEMAHARLTALDAPPELVEWVTAVIRYHSWPLYAMKRARHEAEYDLNNVFESHPDLVPAIALHSAADQLGKGQTQLPGGIRTVLHTLWDTAFHSTKWYFPGARIQPYSRHVVAMSA